MSQNWMRHFELQLVNDKGEGIDLSDFKVTFTIDSYNISSSTRSCTIKIYNLAAATCNRIIGKEFSKIRIIAGYDGIAPDVDVNQLGVAREVDATNVGQSDDRNYGMIFSGDIRFSVVGKGQDSNKDQGNSDPRIDTCLLIQAADSDRAFATTITTRTLAAGYNLAEMNRLLLKDFNANGVTEGLTPDMPSTVYPRGRVLFGMTRDLMDNVSAQCGATWQFVDGKREMVATHEYVHEAIELDSQTGLIGAPSRTSDNGVNVRVLINPNIRLNGLIQLDKYSVYKVAGISYTGDTRGSDWYMDLACEVAGAKDTH